MPLWKTENFTTVPSLTLRHFDYTYAWIGGNRRPSCPSGTWIFRRKFVRCSRPSLKNTLEGAARNFIRGGGGLAKIERLLFSQFKISSKTNITHSLATTNRPPRPPWLRPCRLSWRYKVDPAQTFDSGPRPRPGKPIIFLILARCSVRHSQSDTEISRDDNRYRSTGGYLSERGRANSRTRTPHRFGS